MIVSAQFICCCVYEMPKQQRQYIKENNKICTTIGRLEPSSSLTKEFHDLKNTVSPDFLMAYLLVNVPGTECCDSNHTFLLRSIPSWLIWLKYLSWFLYGNEALAINQWDGISNITCNASNGTCIDTGDKVLLNLGFEKVSHTAKKFRTQYFSFHPNTVDRKSVFKLTIPGA